MAEEITPASPPDHTTFFFVSTFEPLGLCAFFDACLFLSQEIVPGPATYTEHRLVQPVRPVSTFVSRTTRFERPSEAREKKEAPAPGIFYCCC
jgi:hypothetical protein